MIFSQESPPRPKIKKPNLAKSPSTLHIYFKEANNNKNATLQNQTMTHNQELALPRNTVIDDDLAILEDKSTKVPDAKRVRDVKKKPRRKKKVEMSIEKPVKEKKKAKKADR